MKASLIFPLLLLTPGCSNRQVYEAARQNYLQKCDRWEVPRGRDVKRTIRHLFTNTNSSVVGCWEKVRAGEK